MSSFTGEVIDTFSANINQSGLPRPKVEFLDLLQDYGIKNDKFALKDLDSTVMIVGLYTYDVASVNSIDLQYGSLGENILLSFDPHTLKVGSFLKIGQAVIQITQKCTICNHLAVFGKSLPKIVKDCRGLYCKIIKSGKITKGMSVTIENTLSV
ncbi:MAG: MOSC domain-containing protein [Campylobacterota bacterium]